MNLPEWVKRLADWDLWWFQIVVLIALFVVQINTGRARWLILLHPIITTVVVVVTANHYWTDVLAGALLAILGWWLAGRIIGQAPSSTPDPIIDLTEESGDRETAVA